ncbi:MAG: glycosyltransferase [Thermoleophilia bacterium]|nr:glycosyltransferase [Thermoleophilia bacterium]
MTETVLSFHIRLLPGQNSVPAVIAVCMATYNPDRELFQVQIDSIRNQSEAEWQCFISDDGSSPERLAEIDAVLDGDERFTLSTSSANLGFYRNFERAIEMAPREYGLIALSDQDDRWYEDKLASLEAALGDAELVYSDQRLVDASGRVIAETYWTSRENNFTNLTSLLVANTVTGAASMFTRAVADRALPFPEVPGEQYHDHWLAMVAISIGDLVYVDRPLYDYVQHGGAVLGHDAANAGLMSAGWQRLDPRRWREILGGWGSAYFDVFLRLKGLAQIVLERCRTDMPEKKRRALARFASSDRKLSGMFWLALRPFRRLFGHNETLGMERVLVRGILYRHLMAVKRRLPGGVTQVAGSGELKAETEVTAQMRQKVAPLFPVVSATQPQRVNLLIPSIDLDHLFGGYIAKFSLARRLAEQGIRTRIVTVDPTPPLPKDWRDQVESYRQLDGLFDQVEVDFGRDGREPLRLSPDDRFIATTWWTAHIASRLASQSGNRRFLYMIQEYEPLTVPPGAWADLAEESYGFEHGALFSTSILRDYFADNQIGVYRAGLEEGDRHSLYFGNAITPVAAPDPEALAKRSNPSLIFYGRPEQHAARNLYDVGIGALRQAISEGAFGEEWSFHGIGSTRSSEAIDLGGGQVLELVPRTDQDSYARLLAGHDLGLALMDAPHPSLVPIEMASAGMIVVTTTYGTSKTPEKMAAISGNLIAVPPDTASISAGLTEAVGRIGDFAGRAAAADVAWASDWNQALDDGLMERIIKLLEVA